MELLLSFFNVKVTKLMFIPLFVYCSYWPLSQDVFQNYCAGFFLFAAQPFRPGDTVLIHCCSSGSPPSLAPSSHISLGTGWFEGVCESVDLRYTVLRNGRYRFMIPNSRFVEKEFLVMDTAPLVQPSANHSSRSRRQTSEAGNGSVFRSKEDS